MFKIKYLPSHTYQMSGTSNINITTDLSNVPQIAGALTAQGITEPINAQADIQLQASTVTGAAATDGTVPYNMSFNMAGINVNVNGKQIPIPVSPALGNVKMSGHIADGLKLSVDSVNGKKVPDSVAAKTMSIMNNMFKMITFPDHPMKPGDSFTQNMPFSLPMGKGFDINIKITYTLISVSGGKAYFDIVQDINMQMNIKDKANVNITGSGTGKMVYDVANNFFSSYDSNATMKVNVKADKMDINANLATKSSMTYVITENK
jgi:hypothetical protein